MVGDKIISIDGETVTTPSDMQRIVKSKKPGKEVRYKVEREDAFETVVVTIGRRGDYIR
jgi:PDZ domain-containing secreted protein